MASMEETKSNALGTEPLGRLMLQFCVPAVISLLVNMLYNLVDQVFIGRGVGYFGNAATSIIMPQTTMVLSVGSLLGCGCAAYASLSMGRGEDGKAEQAVGTTIIATVVIGVALAVLFESFMTPLCHAFGATQESLPYAKDYGRIIAIGFPFYICTAVFANIFRVDNRPHITLIGMAIGFVVNMILDPLLVLVLRWGVKGAAIATITGQILNALYYAYNLRHCRVLKLDKKAFNFKFSMLRTTSWLGISAFISQAELVLIQLVTNNALAHYGAQSKYGADIPIAAYGISLKLLLVFSGVGSGIISGSQSIIGFNYGSKQYDRVKKVYWRSLGIATAVLVVAFFLFQLAPEAVVHLFGQDSQLYEEFAIKSLRIYMMLCPISGFCTITPVFFQSIGKPVQATVLSVCRQMVFFLFSVVIMTHLIGVEGVLWSGPISNALSAILTVCMLGYYWKRIFKEEDREVEQNG